MVGAGQVYARGSRPLRPEGAERSRAGGQVTRHLRNGRRAGGRGSPDGLSRGDRQWSAGRGRRSKSYSALMVWRLRLSSAIRSGKAFNCEWLVSRRTRVRPSLQWRWRRFLPSLVNAVGDGGLEWRRQSLE